MRRTLGLVIGGALALCLACVVPALAQGAFVGPWGGGGWSGTISGSNLIYNSQTYLIVNGRVTFPDCTMFIVAPNGALLGGAVIPGCTPTGGGGPVTPTITWSTPAAVTVGAVLSGTQLNAQASVGATPVAGTYAYTPPASTALNTVGSQTLSVTFTPTDLTGYTTATNAVQLQVNAAGGAFVGPGGGGGWSGTISGSNLIYNSQSYPIVNGRVNFPDCTTFIVAPNGALLGGAPTPNCTPGGGGGGGGGGPVTPTITWNTPAVVTVGTLVSGTQLNASSGGIAGTFVYTPQAGTPMNTPGSQTLSVTFTPTDLAAYTTAARTVQLQVNASGGSFVGPQSGGGWSGAISGSNLIYNGQTYSIVNGRVNFPDCTTFIVAPNGALIGGAPTPNCTPGGGGGGGGGPVVTPTITWNAPASVAEGTVLSVTQLNAQASIGATPVAGTFVYTPPAGTAVNTPGSQTLSVTFTPVDLTSYTTATATVQLQVNVPSGAPPVFVGPDGGGGWSATISGSSIIYNGQRYSIVNGRVTFSNCKNYVVAANGALMGGVVVPGCVPGVPTIAWPSPAPIWAGTALSATQLNATASIDGTFAYTLPAGTVMNTAGTLTFSVTFTPTDITNWVAGTATVTLTVKGAPPITWANPAAIAGGSALSSTQLNATASTAGTFVYSPPLGTVMNTAGSQTLSTTFTPTDLVNFTPVTASVRVVVKQAPVVAWATPAAVPAGTALSATQLNAIADVAGSFVYTPAAGTVLATPGIQTLSATFTPTDLGNYITVTRSVTLVVTRVTPPITWAAPPSIPFGTALSVTQLNATAGVPGTFSYAPPSGTVFTSIGTKTLMAFFTPTDTASYNATSASVTIDITFAGPDTGGPAAGTINGTNITYGGATFRIVNGSVNFPDCNTWAVNLVDGTLSGKAATPNCVVGSSLPPPNPLAPSTDGQIVGTRLAIISGAASIWAFDAAWDSASGRYLVVGYAGNYVYGQFMGRDGNPIGGQFVIAAVGAYRPRVVSNGAGLFAVVYTGVIGANYSLELRLVETSPTLWPGGVSAPTIIKASADTSLTYQTGITWNPVLQQYLVAWASWRGSSTGVSVSGFNVDGTPGLAETPITEGMPCGNTGTFAKRALSEIAMAPDGTAMIVGYTDTTSASCAGFGGLWYRALTPNGVPIGSVGIVQGTTDGGLHREHRVAYSPVLNRFLAVWTRSTDMPPTIYAQKLRGDGTRDGSAYVVMAGNFTNADLTDNGYGQVGLAYDAAADQFEIAVRGSDSGNGIAPVWRMRLGSDGLPKAMTPVRVNSGTVDPWPVVVADGTGDFLIVYRLDYTHVTTTLISPDGVAPTPYGGSSSGGVGGNGSLVVMTGGTPAPLPNAPNTTGSVGATNTAIQSGGSAIWSFDAAYDPGSGRYLVVGYFGYYVWGQFMDRDGRPLGAQFVIAPIGAYAPRVVSNGTGLFAVTYTGVIGTSYSLELRFVEVTPSVWPGGVSPAVVISAGGDYALTYRTGLAWQPVLQQFLVAWSHAMGASAGVSVSGFKVDGTPGLAATTAAEGMPCGGTGDYAKRALSEFAVAPDGSAMIVGYADTTNPSCAPFGGLWYRALAPTTGLPIGSVGIVQGVTDGDLHREHRVAWSPTMNRFLTVWTRAGGIRPTIYAQKLRADGTRDGNAYVVMAPNFSSADVTDDGFGQVGLAYDAGADQFEVAVRGNDPPNSGGIAPVWRIRLGGSDGLPKNNMAPVKVTSATVDPWPVVAADGTGRFLIVYRVDYTWIVATLITP